MDNNILVQNLCKQFEGFSLDNVSFKVPKGRIVGFIGENGAGKSTTINLILNLSSVFFDRTACNYAPIQKRNRA